MGVTAPSRSRARTAKLRASVLWHRDSRIRKRRAGAFERIDEAGALAIGARYFGIDDGGGRARRLDTERDDSFQLEGGGRHLLLKIAHPADAPPAINLQTAALRHAVAADATLPLQFFVPSITGEREPVLAAPGPGAGRIARMLSWLPGRPLEGQRPDAAQLELLGGALGRLGLALRGFEHPAARRPFGWDTAQLPMLRPLLELFPGAELTAVFERFERHVAPRLGQLPAQVIHNDFHPGNVLADAAAPGFVTGILDFGDVVYTARVVDVAVAVSYLLSPGERGWAEIEHFLRGFESVTPLEPLERELLPEFVAARLAGRVLMNSWLARGAQPAATILATRRSLATMLDEWP